MILILSQRSRHYCPIPDTSFEKEIEARLQVCSVILFMRSTVSEESKPYHIEYFLIVALHIWSAVHCKHRFYDYPANAHTAGCKRAAHPF